MSIDRISSALFLCVTLLACMLSSLGCESRELVPPGPTDITVIEVQAPVTVVNASIESAVAELDPIFQKEVTTVLDGHHWFGFAMAPSMEARVRDIGNDTTQVLLKAPPEEEWARRVVMDALAKHLPNQAIAARYLEVYVDVDDLEEKDPQPDYGDFKLFRRPIVDGQPLPFKEFDYVPSKAPRDPVAFPEITNASPVTPAATSQPEDVLTEPTTAPVVVDIDATVDEMSGLSEAATTQPTETMPAETTETAETPTEPDAAADIEPVTVE